MKSLTRTASGLSIAVALAFIVAAPVAAAPPTRSTHPLGGTFTLPAGTACAFDVGGEPDSVSLDHGFVTNTAFSNGTAVHFVRAKGTYVNLDTGARYSTLDTFRDVSAYDTETGTLGGSETGNTTWSFLPGDIGPFGVVGGNGALYHFVGSVAYTYDVANNQFMQFSYTGTVEDVCAALS